MVSQSPVRRLNGNRAGHCSFSAEILSCLKPQQQAIMNQMDEQELTHWLDALAAAGLIGEWQWDLEVEPGEPAGIQYWIDGRRYTHDGAVKLVRDFEAARVL